MAPPPNAEKANLQSHLNNLDRQSQQQSQDLPPAYENSLVEAPTPTTQASTGPSHHSRQQRSISIPSQNPLHSLARLTRFNFAHYLTQIPASTISTDQVTITTTHPEYSAKQFALAKFIREQAALPPKPIMIVRGTHSAYSGGAGATHVDFEIRVNLTGLLDLDSGSDLIDGEEGGGRIRVKIFQPTSASSSASPSTASSSTIRQRPNESPLDTWIRKFTTESSSSATGAENRSFTISRVPVNFPIGILEGHVRTLIAATRYRGKVTVEFPVLYKDVVVSRTSGNWFVKLVGLYNVKRFEVVESVWSVGGGLDEHGEGLGDSDFAGSSSSVAAADREGYRNGRAGLVAQEWWKEWKPAMLNAVLGGKKGWVTVEDWLEAKMGVKEKDKGRDWGMDG